MATTASDSLDTLLHQLVSRQASDLHLKAGRPPLLRCNGRLEALDAEVLAPEVVHEMLDPIIPAHLHAKMERDMSVDFGYGLTGVSRFRASVFCQRGTRAAVFRRVPFDCPSLEDWGLPPVLGDMCELSQGLVLITGPTGSGKSSTLAALMKRIVETRDHHVVTIEDPIEFLIKDDRCSISQREIGIDTPSFSVALRSILRQDPDVIMVGEMRDEETIRTVLAAAETGHLVLSTLHTNSAYQTIERIVGEFSGSNHKQVCQQLSASLEAVASMQLVPRADGEGMVAAVEILRRSPQVSKLILNGEIEALHEEIESSVSYHRMQSMNQSLAALVIHGTVTLEAAMAHSTDPGALDLLLCKTVGAKSSGDAERGKAMADPTSDFSRILRLQDIGRQYDELKERQADELKSRDREIEELREQLRGIADRSGDNSQLDALRQQNQKLNEQVKATRAEYESKLERLNARIRELTAKSPETPAEQPARRGLFRR